MLYLRPIQQRIALRLSEPNVKWPITSLPRRSDFVEAARMASTSERDPSKKNHPNQFVSTAAFLVTTAVSMTLVWFHSRLHAVFTDLTIARLCKRFDRRI